MKKIEIADVGYDDRFVKKSEADEYERSRYIFVSVDYRLVRAYEEASKAYYAAVNSLNAAHREAMQKWMAENPGKYRIGGGVTSST